MDTSSSLGIIPYLTLTVGHLLLIIQNWHHLLTDKLATSSYSVCFAKSSAFKFQDPCFASLKTLLQCLLSDREGGAGDFSVLGIFLFFSAF